VLNTAPYASIIELGRRPGKFPPPGVLRGWITRRLGKTEAEARAMEFVVSRAIARRGLRARLVMTNSLPKMKQVVMREVMRAISGVI